MWDVVLAGTLAVALGGLLVARTARGDRKQDEARLKRWDVLAKRYQAKLVGSSALFRRPARLEGSFGGSAFVVDAILDPDPHTRITASADNGMFNLLIQPHPSRQLQLLKNDAPITFATGDALFDSQLRLSTNNRMLADAWLDADMRQAILAARPFAFDVQRKHVRAACLESQEGDMHDAIVALARLAMRGGVLSARWEEIVRTLHAVTVNPFNFESGGVVEVLREGSKIRVEIVITTTVVTRIAADVPAEVKVPEVKGARVTRVASGVALEFDGLVLDGETVAHGVHVLAGIAAKASPYR